MNRMCHPFVRELLPSLKRFFHCELEGFLGRYRVLNATMQQYEIYLDAPERDWITCKAFVSYGEDKFSIFDRSVSAQHQGYPGRT